MYRVELSDRSQKFLRKCEPILRNRIISKLKILSTNPFIQDSKRVENTDYFRVRVGDCRILYTLKRNENLILISKIDKRSKVYRGL